MPASNSYPIKRHLLCAMPLLLTLVLLWVVLGPDASMTAFFSAHRATHPGRTRAMQNIATGADIRLYMFFALLFLSAWRNKNVPLRNFVLGVAAGLIAAIVLCEICKISIGRQRPLTGDAFVPFSLTNANQSFPSGHTTRIVASTLPLAHRYGNILLPLALGCLAALVGFSRVYLSWHYPSDILGGLIMGSIGGYVAWRVSRSSRFMRCFPNVRP
jgi:undecaprenyl-diphosphatase